MEITMPTYSRLFAWIDPRDEGQFLAAYVTKTSVTDDSGRAIGAAGSREPITCLCSSRREATAWIKQEADDLGLPVKWMVRVEE
jgi:hypothetical protein